MTATKRVASLDLDLLHSVFVRRMEDVPCIAMALAVSEKLRKQCIKLTKRESSELLDSIRENPLAFRLPVGRNGRLLNCNIEINDEDTEFIERKIEALEFQVEEIFKEMAQDSAIKVLKGLKTDWLKERRFRKKETKEFRARLEQRWAIPLDTMQHFFTIAAELLSGFRGRIDSDPDRLNLWELQTRFFARGLQVAEEIHCLLSSGFAEAALTRWRTLHEIAVNSRFMSIHGEEAATRYFDHQVVESKKRMKELSSPIWAQVVDAKFLNDQTQLEGIYANLLAKYGKEFGYDYGWAAHHLGTKKPTFKDIEEAVSANHYRPQYQLASQSVHAGSKGLYSPLTNNISMLVVGPSNLGLATPGIAAMESLLQIVEVVIALYPSLDAVVAFKMLQSLTQEVDVTCKKCEDDLQQAELNLQMRASE